jgi:hypothetical protein
MVVPWAISTVGLLRETERTTGGGALLALPPQLVNTTKVAVVAAAHMPIRKDGKVLFTALSCEWE